VRALVSGITGQDGSYLAEFLLAKGYEVHGIMRRSSSFNTGRIEHLRRDEQEEGCRFFTHYGDVTDFASLTAILAKVEPNEIYHLAAQSHVGVSFEVPENTGQVDAIGTLRILEAVRTLGLEARFYNASTSELYGDSPPPQDEGTAFRPRSPYACAKLYAYWVTRNYREAYGMFCANGILFNHESPRRGENFVSRKIVRELSRIARTGEGELRLGNLDAKRDWGHARDYVRAMWLMLQVERPDDYVIATGESRTVREFVHEVLRQRCFRGVEWNGDEAHWKDKRIVSHDPGQLRPLEVPDLRGNADKARRELNWSPEYDFRSLVAEMVKEETL